MQISKESMLFLEGAFKNAKEQLDKEMKVFSSEKVDLSDSKEVRTRLEELLFNEGMTHGFKTVMSILAHAVTTQNKKESTGIKVVHP